MALPSICVKSEQSRATESNGDSIHERRGADSSKERRRQLISRERGGEVADGGEERQREHWRWVEGSTQHPSKNHKSSLEAQILLIIL
ncbi:hypothetical protein L6452_31243 [Arctium lappa]|uniref:Uncharacterized protein n=1 Tax=Arctium lappa TaxID=4217 RepID=A0ACB8ZKV2_ARCLA|nr:hypothetical protein L6452_31243 [Arctium lappa]